MNFFLSNIAENSNINPYDNKYSTPSKKKILMYQLKQQEKNKKNKC